jgi:hypothetical protein
MAISSVDLYNFVTNVLANKSQDGAITIDQYNQACFAASLQLWEEYIGEVQNYRAGFASAPSAYIRTNKIESDMAPFRIPLLPISADSSGVIDLQSLSNYGYVTDLYRYQTIGGQEVVFSGTRINEQRLANQLSSRVAPPTLEDPYYMVNNSTIKVFPATSSAEFRTFKITYLKKPDNRVVRYTISGSGRPVITPVGIIPGVSSEYLEWNQQNFNDLAIILLSFLGVNLKDTELIQFSQLKQNPK